MSKVDDVFDFADELVDEWGQYVTFVRKEDSVYDPETGTTTETETRKTVKVVITKLNIKEYDGLYQSDDVKIIIDPVQLDYIYITTQDYFLVPREGADDEHMKIIKPVTYRGDKPVAYVIIARPQ
jgi:Fe-S cluster assembly iron-binding protein IscA